MQLDKHCFCRLPTGGLTLSKDWMGDLVGGKVGGEYEEEREWNCDWYVK